MTELIALTVPEGRRRTTTDMDRTRMKSSDAKTTAARCLRTQRGQPAARARSADQSAGIQPRRRHHEIPDEMLAMWLSISAISRRPPSAASSSDGDTKRRVDQSLRLILIR